MSFEADRESFFEKLNSEIMNVAKKGFPALSFLVSLKKQSVHRFPIPKTSRSNLNSYSNINIDRISSELYPLDHIYVKSGQPDSENFAPPPPSKIASYGPAV